MGMMRELGYSCYPNSRAGRARQLLAAVCWWRRYGCCGEFRAEGGEDYSYCWVRITECGKHKLFRDVDLVADFPLMQSSQFDAFLFTGSIQRSIPALVFVTFLVSVNELVSEMQADSDGIASSIGVTRFRL